jgi:hypothetical protein
VAGAALLGAAGIGAVVTSAGDDESGPVTSVAQAQVPAEGPPPVREVRNKRDGVVLAHPPDWKRKKQDGAMTLESPDRCTVISLAAPTGEADAAAVREATIDALQDAVEKSEVRRAKAQKLGGAPTTGAIVALRNEQERPVVVRVAVSAGKELAHLTEVILRAPPCAASAPATARILSSIEFRR